MSDQNSVVEHQIRPEELRAELSIKKDTYYSDLKFLGIKAEKDSDGKAYLSQVQANRVRSLRSHVSKMGKREGFADSALAQVTVSNSDLDVAAEQVNTQDIPTDNDLSDLIRAAAELKAQQMVIPEMVKLELAKHITYEDFPEDLKQKVTTVREAANPKSQAAQIATRLLSRWRSSQPGGNVA